MNLPAPLKPRHALAALVLVAVAALWWLELSPPAMPAAEVTGVAPPPLDILAEVADRVGRAPVPAAPLQIVDIFPVRTWEPPPPPPVEAGPPPPPRAPPLPFRFLGRIDEPGRGEAFLLADGERVRVVGIGDNIGSDYRVEKYEKGQLVFRYRPMKIRQTLVVGKPP